MSNSKQSPNANNETKKNQLKRGFKIAHLNVRSLEKKLINYGNICKISN